jgi:hypothetical protein
MSKQVDLTPDGDNIPQKKKRKRTTLKEKVHKHITDINDVISEEDIRDAQIDKGSMETDIEKKEEELENNAEVNGGNAKEGKKKVTSWDVLNE